jgi:hypothetical protein
MTPGEFDQVMGTYPLIMKILTSLPNHQMLQIADRLDTFPETRLATLETCLARRTDEKDRLTQFWTFLSAYAPNPHRKKKKKKKVDSESPDTPLLGTGNRRYSC